MFLGHLILGLLLIVPVSGVCPRSHMAHTRQRKNRRAVRMGYALFLVAAWCLLLTGLLLTRAGPLEIRSPAYAESFYWLHVIAPLVMHLALLAPSACRTTHSLASGHSAIWRVRDVASLAMMGLHTRIPAPGTKSARATE